MCKDDVFTLIVVNGDFMNAWDVGTDALRYDNLTWEEAVELAKLSFAQHYECVIWRMPEAENGGE